MSGALLERHDIARSVLAKMLRNHVGAAHSVTLTPDGTLSIGSWGTWITTGAPIEGLTSPVRLHLLQLHQLSRATGALRATESPGKLTKLTSTTDDPDIVATPLAEPAAKPPSVADSAAAWNVESTDERRTARFLASLADPVWTGARSRGYVALMPGTQAAAVSTGDNMSVRAEIDARVESVVLIPAAQFRATTQFNQWNITADTDYGVAELPHGVTVHFPVSHMGDITDYVGSLDKNNWTSSAHSYVRSPLKDFARTVRDAKRAAGGAGRGVSFGPGSQVSIHGEPGITTHTASFSVSDTSEPQVRAQAPLDDLARVLRAFPGPGNAEILWVHEGPPHTMRLDIPRATVFFTPMR